MNSNHLVQMWRSLIVPSDAGYLEANQTNVDGTWIAIDYEGHKHLLVEVPDETDFIGSETRGLSAAISKHQVSAHEPANFIDLMCLQNGLIENFSLVAADICRELEGIEPITRSSIVSTVLQKWAWFWGAGTTTLSFEDELGLFGELWFLLRWVDVDNAAIDAWTGPLGSRHDFQWSDCSIEVKTTGRVGQGEVLHHIQGLDQLSDPEIGQLYLFSLRLVRDELATNSLPNLVDSIQAVLGASPVAQGEFAKKLSGRGYNHANRDQYKTCFRVLGESLYRVTEDFPRLTQSSLTGVIPQGVGGISYVLDMSACEGWKVAVKRSDWIR